MLCWRILMGSASSLGACSYRHHTVYGGSPLRHQDQRKACLARKEAVQEMRSTWRPLLKMGDSTAGLLMCKAGPAGQVRARGLHLLASLDQNPDSNAGPVCSSPSASGPLGTRGPACAVCSQQGAWSACSAWAEGGAAPAGPAWTRTQTAGRAPGCRSPPARGPPCTGGPAPEQAPP